MSSLAGALGDAHAFKVEADIKHSSLEQDVEMRGLTEPKRELKDESKDEFKNDDEEMNDLFGNEDVEEAPKPHRSVSSPSPSAHDSERLPSPERERRQALEYEEEEIPREIAEEVKEADVSFPNLPVPRGSDGSNWVIRMPNFVKVDSKPFHPDTYIGPEQEDEEFQQGESIREKSMSIKLKVENTVRWRWVKDENGMEKRQSNSRIIRWSDGSLSLRLGRELFDINQSLDTSATVPRQFIGSQSQSSQPVPISNSHPDALTKSQGLTYLVAQHKRSQVLQAEAAVTGYMSLRPTGMQSETHRMLVRAVGQKHNKVARLRMAPDPTTDPEREKLELMKQNAKKSKRKQDIDDTLGGRRKRFSRKNTNQNVWSDDDEDNGGIFEGTDEENDGGLRSSGQGPKKVDAPRKGLEDYQEDDFVVADSSDEDVSIGDKRRKGGDGEEDDPLDKIDARIESQERRRDSSLVANDDTEGKVDMEVESEEEEDDDEELKVRRSGSGARKRAIFHGDDDEE